MAEEETTEGQPEGKGSDTMKMIIVAFVGLLFGGLLLYGATIIFPGLTGGGSTQIERSTLIEKYEGTRDLYVTIEGVGMTLRVINPDGGQENHTVGFDVNIEVQSSASLSDAAAVQVLTNAKPMLQHEVQHLLNNKDWTEISNPDFMNSFSQDVKTLINMKFGEDMVANVFLTKFRR
ncbi:MAG: flagellar basal body-associated FliL family protein [Planctomycetes bacterium]|nr:flagellar basal body-associated FliL family protein [Planctomycetota bacterium]